MTTTQIDPSLQTTMGELETALLTPIVSGELLSWVETVQEAAATFGTDWMRCVRTTLHPMYKEIAKSDNDLLTKVEQMRQAEEKLFEDLAQFQERLASMKHLAEIAGLEEGRIEERRQTIENEGMDLILRIKRQQAATATWLAEAQYRDRGVGD